MTPPRANSLRAVGALLLALMLCGCTQWRYELGEPLPAREVLPDAHGLTLRTVLEHYGPPQYISATAAGWVMAWEHLTIGEDSVGISLGLLGADFLNADWGEMQTSGEYLLLSFNRQQRVTSTQRSTWDANSGSGMALQPLASVFSLVDSDDLRDTLPQHAWGSSLLQRLPAGLNRRSNLEEGSNGLQRRGTAGSIGQHSLDTSR